MDKTETEAYFSAALAAQRDQELREQGYAVYLDSIFLQRLKGVSFLGVLDSVYQLRKPSDRYVHTICVTHLALSLARRLSLPSDLERAFVIANILHDVGHAAFSHNSEPFLLERLNLYHEGLLSAFFVRTNQFAPNGTALTKLLEGESPRVAQNVTGLVLQSRKDEPPLGDLFHCPLNCDKIEGNHRTLSHLGRDSIQPTDLLSLFQVRSGRVFIETTGIDLLTDFWAKERDVYWGDIYTSAVFSAEAMLTRALELFFEGPGTAEEFLFMTDDEALHALAACAPAHEIVNRVRSNALFISLSETCPTVLSPFQERLREHRFSGAIRREIESEIAEALQVPANRVISHFSRRKHFAFNFQSLRQFDLFDGGQELLPIERVVSAFKNSKKSGDFFDVFWAPESRP